MTFEARPWNIALAATLGPSPRAEPVRTGINRLDQLLGGGLRPGTLTVLDGPPGVGTSSLLLDVLRHTVFGRGLPAIIYCADRSERDIVLRIIAAQNGLPLRQLTAPRAQGSESLTVAELWDERKRGAALEWARSRANAPLAIATSPATWSPDSLIGDLVARQQASPDTLIGLDVPGAWSQREFGPNGTTSFPRALKMLAVELDVPIVVTAGRSGVASISEMSLDVDTCIRLSRPDSANREDLRAGEVDLDVITHTEPRTVITVAHRLHTGRLFEKTVN